MGNNHTKHELRKQIIKSNVNSNKMDQYKQELAQSNKENDQLRQKNAQLSEILKKYEDNNFLITPSSETFFDPSNRVDTFSSSCSSFPSSSSFVSASASSTQPNTEHEKLIKKLEERIEELSKANRNLKKKEMYYKKHYYNNSDMYVDDDIEISQGNSEQVLYPNAARYLGKEIKEEDVTDKNCMGIFEDIFAREVKKSQFKNKKPKAKHKFLSKLLTQFLKLIPEEELVTWPAAKTERQRLKAYFDEAHLTYLSDKQKISLSTLDAIRQLQKQDHSDLGKDAMLIASMFRIKRYRKLMAIAGEALLNPKILSNKQFWQMDLDKTIKQFIRRRYAIHLSSNEEEIIKVQLCFTYDGTRWGSKSLVLGGFKVVGTQSRDDCFVTTIFAGTNLLLIVK